MAIGALPVVTLDTVSSICTSAVQSGQELTAQILKEMAESNTVLYLQITALALSFTTQEESASAIVAAALLYTMLASQSEADALEAMLAD